MSKHKFETDPVWTPSENSGRKMKEFMKIIEKKQNLKFGNYWEFHKWSVEHVSELWEEMWHFAGVISSKTFDKVIDLSVPLEDGPKWFEGARLNFGENLLKFRDDHVALLLAGEDREVERVTYKQLYEESRLYAAAFRKMGLKKGDVVTCYMSNRKEPVIAMIAVTSIGAIWTGGLPLLGTQVYINRVKQYEPKVLLTVDQYSHKKEIMHLLQNAKEIAAEITSLKKVIIVPSKPDSKLKDISGIKNSIYLDDFLNTGYNADGTVTEYNFEQVSFSHPVFINYTSGSTGLPKSVVHGFGVLLPCIRDLVLHVDSDRNDVWLCISSIGWATWITIIQMLFNGVTLMIFEGDSFFLTPTFIWDMVDNFKLSRLLIKPRDLEEMEAKGYIPTEKHHLSSLRTILTGSTVVKPRSFDFVLNKIKPGITFSVMCGSTEVMSAFLVTEFTLPLYKGEMNPCLGVDIECLDEKGNPLTGEIGELTISTPIPSLPLFLWKDYDRVKFKNAYFSKYAGKLTLGDAAMINPITKGIIMCGRSDASLNPKGICYGSFEIYDIVELFPEILDSLCVAQYNADKKERVVLFVKMKEGYSYTQELEMKLRERIERELSVIYVPEIILEVTDIPYNANGKKMEILVKKIINNLSHNTEMVKNSECLQYYYNIPKLQDSF